MPRAGLWTTLLVALAMIAAPAAKATTVWLAIPDGAEPCSFDQLAAALRSRLPDVRVEAGTYDLDAGDVAVALHRDIDGWSLAVHAAGEHELRRKLPPVGVDCVGLSQTLAFMVERYLGEVQWTGAQVVVAPLSTEPPRPDHAWQGTAELGLAAALTSGSSGLNPALQIDLGARRGPWELGVSVTGELRQDVQVEDGDPSLGTVQYVPAAAQLVGGWRFKLGPGALRLELMPGVQLTWGSLAAPQSASILNPTAAVGGAFTLGGRVAWEVPIYRRLFAALRLAGRVMIPEYSFTLGGLSTPPYLSGYGSGEASLALGYLFF